MNVTKSLCDFYYFRYSVVPVLAKNCGMSSGFFTCNVTSQFLRTIIGGRYGQLANKVEFDKDYLSANNYIHFIGFSFINFLTYMWSSIVERESIRSAEIEYNINLVTNWM